MPNYINKIQALHLYVLAIKPTTDVINSCILNCTTCMFNLHANLTYNKHLPHYTVLKFLQHTHIRFGMRPFLPPLMFNWILTLISMNPSSLLATNLKIPHPLTLQHNDVL
jgi:hypothetical protein